jgi:hypothetical protein
MDRISFIRAILDLYLGLPDTAARRPSRNDHALASQLFDRGIALHVVRAALLLASARRSLAAPALPLIRSLHYFLPVIEELIASGPSEDYLRYIHRRFGHLPGRPSGQISTERDGQ